jgi:cytochrome bd-type quinol oxidase subunit 2
MDNITSNENVLPNIKTPKEYYIGVGIIIFLIISLLLIYFKVNLFGKRNISQDEVTANVFIILSFCVSIFLICIVFLPNMKDIKKLFEQISSVTYAIAYTIGLILFFGFIPSTTINKYAYIFLPFTALLGLFVFYMAGSYSYVDEFNINYERIKSIILFFCLIITFIIFYNEDPGGYITKYFGYTSVISIVIAVFAFLYLIIVLTLPDKYIEKSESSKNFMSNFSTFTTYGIISFVIFIIMFFLMIFLYNSKDGFFDNKNVAIPFIIISIIIFVLWSVLIGVNIFPEFVDKTISTDGLSLFKKSLLVLFGIVISGLIIAWIAITIQDYAGYSSWISFFLNIAIVIIILGLIYKIINTQIPIGNNKKNAIVNLIINILFYIPCFFSGIFDSIGKIATGNYSGEAGTLLMLIIVIILIIIYFSMPSVFNVINTQGGQQLVNKPVNTNTSYALGTYAILNGSEQYDYQFAISFWVFVHAAGSNMNQNYNKYTSLLNFGGKPNVLYNGKTNTLMVTMKLEGDAPPHDTDEKDKNKLYKLTDIDENGNTILYTNSNFMLQKWNNIIINYNGGVLDIFLNGELVKSNIGIVPYYKLDNLTIGENGGIEGGICNVVYFRKPLTTNNIYYLYNMVKDRTPPLINDINKTIMV